MFIRPQLFPWLTTFVTWHDVWCPAAVTGQRRLLISCVGAAGYIWGVHLLHALSRASTMAGVLPWMTTAAWALALDMTTFMIVYVLFSLAGTMAAATRAPRAWEHGLTVALAAAGLCELLRRVVL